MINDEKTYTHTFIAYRGIDINVSSIEKALNSRCPENYTVNKKTNSESDCNIIFAKIVPKTEIITRETQSYSEPMLFDDCFSVSAYEKVELMDAYRDFLPNYRGESYAMHPAVFNHLYYKKGSDFFKILSDNQIHFCSVVYNIKKESLIAGVTEPSNEYTHLYYGYTERNHEVMFSNDKTVLVELCSEVNEMPKNTYMENGKLYTFDCNEIKNNPSINKASEIESLQPNESKESSSLPGNQRIKEQMDELIKTVFLAEYQDEKINNFIKNEIQKKTLQVIKETIEKVNLDDKIEEEFDKKLDEYTSKIQVPTVNIIKLNDTVVGKTSPSFYHEKFNQILSQVQLDEPIMLIGPAGSGKNVAISQVAEALGLHMYYTNNASNEFKLTGFIDAGGNYKETEFYKAFKNGGIFFLDEIDNSDPSSLIVINSALANGYMAFPHETIDRNPNFRIIAAANTWGKGADLQYVGRNALDAATLDRFDNIFFDYDQNLEKALYPNKNVLEFMWAFRDAVYQCRIPHIVSTRGIGKVYKKEINGIPVQDILTSNIVKNLGQDDVNTIIGNMHDIDKSNKYYDGIKQLKLRR